MMPRSDGGIKIEDSSEDVQILKYTPRVGGDGEYKVFNYKYSSRGSASDAPRTVPDIGELDVLLTKGARSHLNLLPLSIGTDLLCALTKTH